MTTRPAGRLGETNKFSLEEAGDGLTEQALTKSCMTCSHFKTCAILGLFKSGIEPQFPEIIKSENLAWICSEYDEKLIAAPKGDNSLFSKKVIRKL